MLPLLAPIAKSIFSTVDKVITSKAEKEKIKAELQHKIITGDLKEIEAAATVIQLEAQGTWLQRSWRPLIGMSCALAIFWEFVLSKFILFICGLLQYEVVNIPELDMGTLMPLVMSLLGMGALRTFEKTKGISK